MENEKLQEAIPEEKGGKLKSRTRMTKEIYEKIILYLTSPKYKGLTQEEIATLTDTSVSTVCRVKNGDYDYFKETSPLTVPENEKSYTTIIPYDEFQTLINCKNIIKEMIESAMLDDKHNDALYVPRGTMNRILKRFVPDQVEKKLAELNEPDMNNFI